MTAVVRGLEDELGGPDKVSFRQHLIIKIAADLALRHQLAIGRYVREVEPTLAEYLAAKPAVLAE